MADETTATPMDDGDVTPPPATTEFEAATPLKETGVDFTPATTSVGATADGSEGRLVTAAHTARDGAASLGQQAADKVRSLADTGKEKAGDALDQLVQMLTDAAGQVDEKLGVQYGDYARNAASTVQGFAQTVRDKDVDAFAEDVRGYIRQSPGAAVGIAAALGFVMARVVHAGLDQRG